MSKYNPAFPRTGYFPDVSDADGDSLRERLPSITEPQEGMSLRDYFAAKAMQAITPLAEPENVARNAYTFADAMLAERAKAEGTK